MIDNGPITLKISGGSAKSSTISIGAAETGYSDAFELIDCDDFSLAYKIACTGTPDVKLQLQERVNSTDNWCIPDNMADLASSITDKNQHICRLAPLPARYLRIVAVEQTSVVDDTVVTVQIIAQRKFTA